jgi:hypothetical protein
MTDEELVNALKLLAFVHNDGAITQAADRIEALTAELAKVVEAKQLASDAGPCVCFACLEARALLAEIEGKEP